MALVGLSLILASVVYLAFRRPPFVQTLLALWRRDPRIDQPKGTASPRAGTPPAQQGRDDDDDAGSRRPPVTITTTGADDHGPSVPASLLPARPAVNLPPEGGPLITTPDDDAEPSAQTTPKAVPAVPSPASSVPSFSLSSSPPASAASQARADARSAPAQPVLSAAPVATPAASLMMPPPPRPPTLNNVNNTNMLSPAPSRRPPNSMANSARQPGTSTLAPPPTHSSKPAKPSRKVILNPGHSPLDWARLAQSPTSDLRNLPAGTPYLKVTPSMLRKQTGRKGKDAWTVFGGRVYNITPYLPFHPGGEPELLRVAGRDGTRLFGEIHPWVNYEGMLASSLIGMLVEEGEEQKNEMDAMD